MSMHRGFTACRPPDGGHRTVAHSQAPEGTEGGSQPAAFSALSFVHSLITAAAAGAAVLALEVLAARTLAPSLGSGPAAWSALLAVALGTLALGNLAGGMLANRRGTVAWSFILAAAALVLLAVKYQTAVDWAAEHSLVAGSLLAAAAVQAVPMFLLGTISPVILTAGKGRCDAGRWSGLVLAAGSGGGIAGALAAALVGLPALGIARCYLAVAGGLLAIAMPAVVAQRRWIAGFLALATLGGGILAWCSKAASGDETDTGRHEERVVQSLYGQVELRERDEGSLLVIDGLPQTGLPGRVEPWDGLRSGYLLEAALLNGNRPRKALVIGLGAGLAPRLLAAHGIDCEAVEIDPAVVEAARACGFDGRATVADGRRFLRDSRDAWDLIVLDVCTSDHLPTHLFTREAMLLVRQRLAPWGTLAVQFIGDDGPWSAAVAGSVESVFGPAILLAPAGAGSAVGPRWILAGSRLPPPGPDAMGEGMGAPWRWVRLSDPALPLTDDHFAAETAWNRTAAAWRRAYRGGTAGLEPHESLPRFER
jgi:spermidine synthase